MHQRKWISQKQISILSNKTFSVAVSLETFIAMSRIRSFHFGTRICPTVSRNQVYCCLFFFFLHEYFFTLVLSSSKSNFLFGFLLILSALCFCLFPIDHLIWGALVVATAQILRVRPMRSAKIEIEIEIERSAENKLRPMCRQRKDELKRKRIFD